MKQKYFFTLFLSLLLGITNAQNNALQMSNDSYFDFNNGNGLVSEFTIEYDFYLNSLTNYNARLISFDGISIVAKPIHFYVNNTGASNLLVGNGSIEEAVPGMPTFNVQQWYHIAIVVTNTTTKNVKVYVNGIAVVNYDFTATLDGFNAQSRLNLGGARNSSVTNMGNAKYDNLRVWSSVRTASEIANNYASCLTGNESNLVSYFKFDGYNGPFIKNVVNNSNFAVVSLSGGFYSYVSGSGCSTTPLYATITVAGNYSGIFYYVGQLNGKPYYKTDNVELDCATRTSQAQCAFTPSYYEIVWINNQWELRYNNCYWELGEECVSLLSSSTYNDPLSINTADTAIPPCTGWSSTNYIFCPSLSVDNTAFEKNISIYPNPNNGYFTIEAKEEETVKVFDLVGKLIYTSNLTIGKNNIDISSYKAGIYVLYTINGTGQTSALKLIKN
jgi:hypothetical protein